ncbi:class I SAM-dependent methyltransferase [Aestuariispira insulae]|uniref:Caffeoyl-CoA O-methyltransferase n=1 Tax=Aestuariispira insulae TaxID=1461337 RepID=A0A3D9HSB6_9PROT|nr:class I SAM-dependent methyltransferase [Aestuariispira insulae]RED52384.1 caffeoyl-CoA O-methyltransferase [Aestuariispira insulae]
MSRESLGLEAPLLSYLIEHGVRESELLAKLREETAKLPGAQMQIAPEQGAFMAMLTRLLDVRLAVEIGVFTGYSSISVAGAMAEDGRLIACDNHEENTLIAKRYWRLAGLDHKIDFRLKNARETVDDLIEEGLAGTVDMAFIDADKDGYDHYYERCLQLLRPGGLVLIDNVLWSGSVIDDSAQDNSTKAIRAINAKVIADDRVDVSMVPIGDGLTMVRKK